MLTATSAPTREQCSHSLVLGKCVHLEWISLLDSIYEITIYLWAILKYLSPHSPSLIYSASSRPRSINGKLLIMLSEMLKRLLRVKGTLISRAGKAARLSPQSRVYLRRKVPSADKGSFHYSPWKGLRWLAPLCPVPRCPKEGTSKKFGNVSLSLSGTFKRLANPFFFF